MVERGGDLDLQDEGLWGVVIPKLIVIVISQRIQDTFITVTATIKSLSRNISSSYGAAQVICCELGNQIKASGAIKFHDMLEQRMRKGKMK
jgi:hypothetical protein